MAPVRLRHPKGVTTIQVDLTNATVQDLQQEIFAATEIPPSQQDLKAGYPPHPLTLVPELPIDSLGLKQGEQLVVVQRAAPSHQSLSSSRGTTSSVLPAPSPAAAMTGLTASQVREPARPTAKAGAKGGGLDYVPTSNGYLIHRIVPDDNSCLFSSIALIFEQDISKAQTIRKICPPVVYSLSHVLVHAPTRTRECTYRRPREEYIQTILKPAAWGGAIELSILAQHYSTEIASIDVETGRIDRFPPLPETDSGNRAISDEEKDEILQAAKKLADALRAKRAFTNTATFDLKCQICGKGLKGEKEARAHASETGHVEFGEY
ncbi:OTU-domain-containing protein [Fomes fomentarius]|nr:OTU-domain-containing protein [Fomes fomentarius]